MATRPWLGSASVAAVTVSGSPSASRSFASTSTVTGVLIGVATASGRADGASFTGMTASVSVACAVVLPSLSV